MSIGTDTRPITIFDYDLNLNRYMKNHLHDAKYDNHVNNYSYPSMPYSDSSIGGNSLNTVVNSGKVLISNPIGNSNKIKVQNSDYSATDKYPIYTPNTSNAVYLTENQRAFASMRFTVVSPAEKLEDNTQLKYNFKIENVTYEENGVEKTHEYNNETNWSKTKLAPGVINPRANYLSENRKPLGSSTAISGPSGDAKINENAKIYGLSTMTMSDTPFYTAEISQRWNPSVHVFDTSRADLMTTTCPSNIDGVSTKPKVEYGVKKIKNYSLSSLRDAKRSDYTWYSSSSSAGDTKQISAVKMVCQDSKGGKLYPSSLWLYVPQEVIGSIGTVQNDGTPNIILNSAQVNWDNDKMISTAGAVTGNPFTPTAYLPNGEVDKMQTPNKVYGDTLNI